MDMDTPTIGHNVGDLPTVEQIGEQLLLQNKEALERTAELLEKGEKYLTISDDDQDAAATQFLVSIRSRYKDSEAERVKEKSVWDDRAGAVHAFFKTKILDPLGLGPANPNEPFDPVARDDLGLGVRINRAMTIYKRACLWATDEELAAALRIKRAAEAEAAKKAAADKAAADKAAAEAAELEAAASRARNPERIAALQAAADAKAAEASEAVAAAEQSAATANRTAEERAETQWALEAPAADKTRARGELGGRSSLKTFLNWRDIDPAELAKAHDGGIPGIVQLLPYIKPAHLEMAVKEWAKGHLAEIDTHLKAGTQPLHGVVYFRDHKNQGRM